MRPGRRGRSPEQGSSHPSGSAGPSGSSYLQGYQQGSAYEGGPPYQVGGAFLPLNGRMARVPRGPVADPRGGLLGTPTRGGRPGTGQGGGARPGSGLSGPERPRGLRPQTRRALVVTGAAGALILGGGAIHPDYVILSAGPAYNTLGDLDGTAIIQVDGAPTYPTSGALDFTTVSIFGGPGHRITLWDYLWGVARGTDMVPYGDVYAPDVTPDQVREEGRAQMVGAQEEAVAVALRATGRSVPATIVIAAVGQGLPADGVLKVGDQVISVAGKPVATVAQVGERVRDTGTGMPLAMVVRRDGKDVPVSLTPTRKEGRQIIGVTTAISKFDFPVRVKINAGDVGGPSAGLMFALGVYDRITPGALTGGAQIAGTGTIADDGTVGPIGGIDHKMVGAKSRNASWFLAPAGNCEAVRGHVPQGLSVVKVATFEQARKAVEEIAAGRGSALPGC